MINEVGKSNSIVKSSKHIIIKIVKKSKLKKNSSITKNKNDNNSLGKLSKKFIDLFNASNASEDKIFQISDIIKKLKIQKRRIYDLINVFEGNVSGSFIILKRNWIY